MRSLLLMIAQLVYCSFYSVLSGVPLAFLASSAVHTLSFEDAIKPEKHIGVFRKRRRVATLFRRT